MTGGEGPHVAVREIELRRVRLELRGAFATAHGRTQTREVLLVRVRIDDADGWGECAAPAAPTYTGEWIDAAALTLRDHLVPRLLGASLPIEALPTRLAGVRGQHMAKAALETACLDAALRTDGRSLAAYLGADRTRVAAGVALGLTADASEVVPAVEDAVGAGYRRVKLKVAPGHDVEPVRRARERFSDLALWVDANGSYAPDDVARLATFDDLGLGMLEQPLRPDDLLGHAALARRITTPIGLDESIESADDVRTALALGACAAVNLKPARVGGPLAALDVHDACVAGHVPAWCGGMLETGIGRAAALAVAALAGCSLPADLAASDRYWTEDLTEPFVLDADGTLGVPTGPGIGVEPRRDVLERATTERTVLRS